MEQRMNWEKLLSSKRVETFCDGCIPPRQQSQYDDVRSPFERDYDQLIFSYPFRRLQDKTQVIPFPKYDFVHTRLTHSLEVASVGRSLGRMAAELIFSELSDDFKQENNITINDIGNLVSAACLAHDIGNPPFGHSGEDAISNFFAETNLGYEPDYHLIPKMRETSFRNFLRVENENIIFQEFDNEVSIRITGVVNQTKKWFDLINFEGNANGFRIMTNNCCRGINPTAALIGTFTKYPRESWLFSDPFKDMEKEDRPKSQTKYGFFQEQRELFKSIADELGLLRIETDYDDDIAYRRHPLAFLMEAADDIAYSIIDFEDGCRLKLIDFDKPYQWEQNTQKTPQEILIELASMDNSFAIERLNGLEANERLSLLRSKVINVLAHEVFAIYKKEYEEIMTGKFDKSLIDCVNENIRINLNYITKIVRENVYNYTPVLETEASGFEVMGTLIDSFSQSCDICYSCGEKETKKHQKLKSILPMEFHPTIENTEGQLTFEEKYKRVLKIIDYVSGMTDNYAVSLYRRIKGITLPTF